MQADMRWKTEMKIEPGMMGGAGRPGGGMPGGMKPSISYTTAVTDGAQRKESQMSMGPFGTNDVVVTLCDKKQRIQIDDELKIYTVSTLTDDDGGFVNPMAGMGSMMSKMLPPGMKIPGMAAPPPGAPATGKVVSTVTAEDKGEETVADTPAHHWILTIVNEKSGCAGTGTDATKMEVWSANFNEPVFCPNATGANPVRDFGNAMRADPSCKITYEMKGDGFETYGKIFSGLVMRLKIYDKTGKPAMTQEVTMLTRAKQESNLFQVPEGYQQVTADEFQQKKGQAMMQKLFKGGLPPGLGG
jgi:hypothetical protein